MWSGRFREPLDHTFEQWQRSFPFDWRLLPHEINASIAHARMIEAAGILTSDELLCMIEGLRAIGMRPEFSPDLTQRRARISPPPSSTRNTPPTPLPPAP